MDKSNEPKGKRMLAWVCLVWGSLILLRAVFSQTPPEATQMYVDGQYVGLLLGFLMLCASVYYLFLRKI